MEIKLSGKMERKLTLIMGMGCMA